MLSGKVRCLHVTEKNQSDEGQFMRRTSIAICVFLFTCSGSRLMPQSVDVQAVQSSMLELRRKINTCEFEAEVERGSEKRSHKIWIDGAYYRGDTVRNHRVSHRPFRVSTVFRGDSKTYLSYTDESDHFGDGGTIVARIDDNNSKSSKLMLPGDPRLVGLVASSYALYPHLTMNTLFQNPEYRVEGSFLEKEGGNLVRLRFTDPTRQVEVFFDPKRLMNVVALVGTYGKTVERIDILLAEVIDYGWFPSEFKFVQLRDGQESQREKVVLKTIQINQPIDPTVFTFVGMGVPNGYPVYDHSVPGKITRLQLSKGRLVERAEESSVGEVPALKEGQRFTRYLWVMSGIGLALLALFFFRGRNDET